MKLIIREYLAALKERGELDVILPDLLSQLGLNVYSRPGRGTRQDGVDVAAVGSLDGKADKVYLFSVKAGDLTRNSWDGDALQSLRPSLNEIMDTYIPNRLPVEHKEKDIVICLCFGGEIQEQVRPQVEGYIKNNEENRISFEEWNGDKLATLIQKSFLREELLPDNARSQLRKSLALIDEPDASYRHFAALIQSLSAINGSKDKDQITAVRQINICLWILYAWSREAGNIEAAYLSSERALLFSWEITKGYAGKKTKFAKAILKSYDSILHVYQQICFQYLSEKILPYTNKLHALSTAVQASTYLDINLRLFDVLGRIAVGGIWAYWVFSRIDEKDTAAREEAWEEIQVYTTAIKQLISKNPALFLPIKDDQAIDVSLAALILAMDGNNHKDIQTWLSEIMTRAEFSLKIVGQYPCNIESYSDLLDHPQHDDDYFKDKTSGSILYPMVALWACILGDEMLYAKVQSIKAEQLAHCNFQLWYPDELSEMHIYKYSDSHGATLSQVCIDRSSDDFQEQAFGECDKSSYFKALSAVEVGLWPLILVACRHYRLPLPIHLMAGLRSANGNDNKTK